MQSGIGAVTGALGVSLGPLLAIIAAVAALVAAFMHLWKTNDEFKSNIIAIWEQIKSTFTGLTQFIPCCFQHIGETLKVESQSI